MDDSIIERVKKDVSIERVIRDCTGITTDNKSKNYLCLFHQEKTPSMHIYNKTNKFHCFGCGAWGDVIALYRKLTDCDFSKAVKELSSKYLNIDSDSNSYTRPPERNYYDRIQDRIKSDYAAYEIVKLNYSEIYMDFCTYINRPEKFNVAEAAPVLEYLQRRGFDIDFLSGFGFLILTNYNQVNNHLKKTYDMDRLKASGLFSETGNLKFYKHKIIIPYFDSQGNIISIEGRRIDNEKERKYLKTCLTYPFNLDTLPQIQSKRIYIAEGVFNCLSLLYAGFPAIALGSANNFKPFLIPLFRKYGISELVFCFDNDKNLSGQKALEKIIDDFDRYFLYRNMITFTMPLPQGVDLNDLLVLEGGAR
jgi:DNA primase catalytic core